MIWKGYKHGQGLETRQVRSSLELESRYQCASLSAARIFPVVGLELIKLKLKHVFPMPVVINLPIPFVMIFLFARLFNHLKPKLLSSFMCICTVFRKPILISPEVVDFLAHKIFISARKSSFYTQP